MRLASQISGDDGGGLYRTNPKQRGNSLNNNSSSSSKYKKPPVNPMPLP